MLFLEKFLIHLARFFSLMRGMFSRMENPRFYFREILHQAYFLGVRSLPIIAMVSIFAGAVTAIQMAKQLSNLNLPFIMYLVGRATRDTVFLEIASTFNGIVLAGVIGSKIASELGNMRVSNQIDALEIMGVNSKLYLVLPKILAFCVMAPFLAILSFFIGIVGAKYGALISGLVTEDQIDKGLFASFKYSYIFIGMLKIFVFSFILSSVSAYFGYHVRGGAIEIGKAATNSVVASCVLILLMDYLLTLLFSVG